MPSHSCLLQPGKHRIVARHGKAGIRLKATMRVTQVDNQPQDLRVLVPFCVTMDEL